jgi:hypothetical protein
VSNRQQGDCHNSRPMELRVLHASPSGKSAFVALDIVIEGTVLTSRVTGWITVGAPVEVGQLIVVPDTVTWELGDAEESVDPATGEVYSHRWFTFIPK